MPARASGVMMETGMGSRPVATSTSLPTRMPAGGAAATSSVTTSPSLTKAATAADSRETLAMDQRANRLRTAGSEKTVGTNPSCWRNDAACLT